MATTTISCDTPDEQAHFIGLGFIGLGLGVAHFIELGFIGLGLGVAHFIEFEL